MAGKAAIRRFSTALEPSRNSLNWVVIRIPFEVAKTWGVRGHLRVKGTINGFPFRTSLFPTRAGHHFMAVNRKMQKGAGVREGMFARFVMEPDKDKRDDTIPPEFARALRQSRKVEKFFNSLPAHMQRFLARLIAEPKQAATRLRRAEQTTENLMEVLEAEIELPPVMRQVFARNPQAAEAWNRLTPSRRRHELIGIFHYRTYDARLRRLQKAIERILGNRPEEDRT
jgi:uncharacterized protein YdeI (YjbR/CyaY-like superfamily)